MKPVLACLSIVFSSSLLAIESQIDQCRQALLSDKYFATQKGCSELLDKAGENQSAGYYQLGKLLLEANHPAKATKRHKRGLFYLVLAADDGNPNAITRLSNYVKTKMIDGKVPLRYSHYIDYLAMDWALQGQPADHHYAIYQRWLDLVEQTRLNPQQQSIETLKAMATNYENGYFLGGDHTKALTLYQIAAAKGDAYSQYKSGELLYDSNPAEALTYLNQAVANHSSEAMLKLGDHYGCLGNKTLALQWYEQAIRLGNEDAVDEKQALTTQGKPSQCDF